MGERRRWWVMLSISLGMALAILAARFFSQKGELELPGRQKRTTPGTREGADPASPRRPLVAIDPGHGGTDLGGHHRDAQGNIDLTESQVNLQVALLLCKKLEAQGCDVYLTRSGADLGESLQDRNGDGEITVRDDLQGRVDRVNEQGADLLISLHQNALDDADPYASCSNAGTTTYYCADRPFAERSLRLATLVHQEVLAAIRSLGYEPVDQGVVDDRHLETPTGAGEHLYILGPQDPVIVRPSLMPGVLSEPLFLTCEPEMALLARDDFRAALAEAYARAIVAYLEGEGKLPASRALRSS